ncbi:MAG TPA: hypothetical protein VFQ95_04110 [Rhodanobacteraceae bacterium]|nr:hypothetical protein [Rhodanobacteraceae bacterium]
MTTTFPTNPDAAPAKGFDEASQPASGARATVPVVDGVEPRLNQPPHAITAAGVELV